MNVNPKHKVALLAMAAMCCLITVSTQLKAQTNIEVYGQNRVQYRDFDWRYFDTKHFKIYHYDAAGRQLARYVAEQVENDMTIIEKKMDMQFPRKFNIILYNNYDEYLQTNIGRKNESQLKDVPAGTVELVGDKLVVYYTGVHSDLRRQTREGMGRVIMERMLFGENMRDMLKNSLFLSLPKWIVLGFTSYMVDGWDTKSNSEWHNMLDARPKSDFYSLAEKNPELTGKAFWKYIHDHYGETTMKSLLYNMQLKSNLNQGIKMTLNMKMKKAFDSTLHYFKDVYAADEANFEQPDEKNVTVFVDMPKDNTIINNFRVAPKGRDMAYVAWKNGEYKVYMQNTQSTQSKYPILEGGRLDFSAKPDPNYPQLAWSNNGYKLAILYKKGTETKLRIYNSIKAKVENYTIRANRFDRVLGMTFNEDDDKLVFSAVKKSQTDLYEFTIRGSKMVNITNDPWDDLQPCFVSGGSRRGIIFVSNRPKPNINVPVEVNQLPAGPMNVFFYNTRTKRKELLQMTHVTSGTISQPIQYGSDNYAFLYDEKGVQNQYVVAMMRDAHNHDSAYAVPVTNYSRNVISHQYNAASKQAIDVVQVGSKYMITLRPLQIPGVNVEAKTLRTTQLLETEKTAGASGDAAGKAGMQGNVFQSEFNDNDAATINPATIQSEGDSSMADMADSTFIKLKAQQYKLSFKPDFLSIKLDNSILFNKYQAIDQSNHGKYESPSLAGLITASLNDLMENHRLTGGFRLPINFSGMTYFLQYENFKKRIDWGILYLRTENFYKETVYNPNPDTAALPKFKPNEQLARTTINLLQGTASYPFDRLSSLRFTLGLRSDKLLYKAQDSASLSYEPAHKLQNWMSSRLEFVFDNAQKPAINIYNGFRYKFFAEFLMKLNDGGGSFYNFGTDFRYYQKIYKNWIWAIRLAGATSVGKQKILYQLGGVDNWIDAKYSSYVPIRQNDKYAFQTLATNMRGYEYNARNGNSYAVINMELRLPIFSTLIKRPIQSGLIKNLQLVGFTDIGSAWQGLFPNADALQNNIKLPDPLNSAPNPPVTLTIVDQTGGLCMGYGGGLRTMLFGYFGRVDAAWNIEGRTKPIIYCSIGVDF